jgi:hypothetical protein
VVLIVKKNIELVNFVGGENYNKKSVLSANSHETNENKNDTLMVELTNSTTHHQCCSSMI